MAARSERTRFEALTDLHGVGAPMASAILTLTNPRRYGVGFVFDDWHHYLVTLRDHAKRAGASVRAVEYSLFLHHQRGQRGTLYGGGR